MTGNTTRLLVLLAGLSLYPPATAADRRTPEPWFDEAYYLDANPDVARAVAAGFYRSGFDHYVRYGMKERRSPGPWFSESWYLARYPDVAQAVQRGALHSGAEHFARWGMKEGRSPTHWFDEALYLRRYPAVADSVRAGRVRSGLEHYLLRGRTEGFRPEAPSAGAVQTVYRSGVPHTDGQGRIRHAPGPASFFPRCIYHAVAGSFRAVREAGFNCAHVWEGHAVAEVIGEARAAGVRLIPHWPTDDEVAAHAADPRVLAWYLDEEPTAQTYLDSERSGEPGLMARRYRAFLARKAAIKARDPERAVFPLGSAWIPPRHENWWAAWNSAGDLTAHDNYPLVSAEADLEPLAVSVPRAVRLNGERKPMWLALQAFTRSSDDTAGDGLRMPTPAELRAMAFTSIVHGATGLIYFALDSRVTREGLVVGMAPETLQHYGGHGVATPEQVRRSRELWAGAAALNAELDRLVEQILSPTAGLDYAVYFSGESRTAGPVRSLLKGRDGRYTLFAVNLEPRPLGVRFDFPTPFARVVRLEPDGSATPLPHRSGEVRDALGPFGVGVYDLVVAE